MQIIENWTDVAGTVRSCRPAPAPPGFVAVEIAVAEVGDVEGFANLLGRAAGGVLAVLVPAAIARRLSIAPGDAISCRVRRADLQRNFVHREHISVGRGS